MALSARLLSSLDDVDPVSWNALRSSDNPFVSHEFLSAMERTGCLRPDWGWTAHHLTLWDDDALVAAAPMYLKANSHGEFVFDHAWARACSHPCRPSARCWRRRWPSCAPASTSPRRT